MEAMQKKISPINDELLTIATKCLMPMILVSDAGRSVWSSDIAECQKLIVAALAKVHFNGLECDSK